MADRTAVPLDQAASLYPQVPRQQRERHSAANPRGDDRLSAAAHRGAGPLHHHAANPSRSARQPTPVLATHDYANRQTYTGQPQQPQATQMPRPDGVLLCLTFPRTALRTRGEVEQAAKRNKSFNEATCSPGNSPRLSVTFVTSVVVNSR